MIFGISFLLLGAALIWRIIKTVEDTLSRNIFLGFSALVILSGIFCFVVEVSWTHLSVTAKIPLYACLGISLSFALTFSFTEMINLGLCDKCCNTHFEDNPLISNRKQVIIIFSGAIFLGSIFGILFGSIDVEDDDSRRSKLKENLIWSIPIGAIIGGLISFLNQWMRTLSREYVVVDRVSPDTTEDI